MAEMSPHKNVSREVRNDLARSWVYGIDRYAGVVDFMTRRASEIAQGRFFPRLASQDVPLQILGSLGGVHEIRLPHLVAEIAKLRPGSLPSCWPSKGDLFLGYYNPHLVNLLFASVALDQSRDKCSRATTPNNTSYGQTLCSSLENWRWNTKIGFFYSPLLGPSPLWKACPPRVLMQGWQNRLIIPPLYGRVNHTTYRLDNNAFQSQISMIGCPFS